MIILDSCVDEFLAEEIERIFFDQYTNWWYDPSTLGNFTNSQTKDFSDTFQFVHPITDNNRHDSIYSPLVLTLADKIFLGKNLTILNYRRVKVNQLLKNNSNTGSHPPHIDDTAENMVSAIYYINDSDGPTYFYDLNYNVTKKVDPKKNRCVIFPSNQLHASSSPQSSNRRLVINIVASTSNIVDLKI